MDVKKACLKIQTVSVCLLFLIIFTSSTVACSVFPTASEKSQSYVAQISTTSATTIYTATLTFLSYVDVSPVSGQPGTTVIITGRDFIPMTNVIAWFDSNGNSFYDISEPSISFVTTIHGTFPDGVVLVVPSLPAGDYFIFIKSPYTPLIDFSFVFHITGFNLIPWLWIIGGIIIVVIVSVVVIKTQLTKKNTKRTEEKFKNGEITLKMSNVQGKSQVSPDTPLKAGNSINVRLTKSAGSQSIRVEGSLIRDGKEEK